MPVREPDEARHCDSEMKPDIVTVRRNDAVRKRNEKALSVRIRDIEWQFENTRYRVVV